VEFLANENFPLASIRLLRMGYHKVESVVEKFPGIKDREVLEFAKANNLVILTFDRDYGELTYRFKLVAPAGVVYFRFSPSTPEEPAKILLSIMEKGIATFSGKFTVVEREGMRQRKLPVV
jgi:predicted nuclease of predicted toxin-antitoxin system